MCAKEFAPMTLVIRASLGLPASAQNRSLKLPKYEVEISARAKRGRLPCHSRPGILSTQALILEEKKLCRQFTILRVTSFAEARLDPVLTTSPS